MALSTMKTRAAVLFCVGTFFSIILNLLQKQRGIPNLPVAVEFYFSYLSSDWWVHPVVGIAAGLYQILVYVL